MQACQHLPRRALRAPPPPAPARAAAVRGRARAVRAAAGVTDQSARVRGDPARVCFATADVGAWPAWSPVTKSAVKLGTPGAPIQKGTRFELKQELFGGIYSYAML